MKPTKVNSRVDSNFVFHLNIPIIDISIKLTNAGLELGVVLKIKKLNSSESESSKSSWSPNFFEKTFGAWQGEALIREPQGEYEQREEFL